MTPRPAGRYRADMCGRRRTIGLGLIGLTTVLRSTPATADDTIAPTSFPADQPGVPGGGGVAALVIIGILVSVGLTIWKFSAIRDMGVRRGMSRRDASTAAFFSDDSVMLGMVLKDEEPHAQPLSGRHDEARSPTLEERLAKLERLRVAGSITDEEAAARRAEIIDEI